MLLPKSNRHISQVCQKPQECNRQQKQKQVPPQSTLPSMKLFMSSVTLWCLVLCCGPPNAAAHIDEIISVQEGKMVILPCPVNKKTCGDLHSINWFKGDHRIAVYLSDESNSTNVIEDYEDRVSVTVDPYQLIIRDLKIADEDIFMCDTTYFIPAETCENFNGYRIELNVLVPPSEVVVLDEKGDRLENESIIGPLQERHILKASCVVRNTRPQPQVGWWSGDKRLTTHSPSYDERDGLYTATLELVHKLTRDDLLNDIECRAESSAIPNPIKYHFGVDLQVRPTSITINGVEHHTVQGSKVVLTCDVHGARPPVNLTWYNSTTFLPNFQVSSNGSGDVGNISPIENELTEIRTKAFKKEDGTYHTQSELIFNATRFENDKVFRCSADNIVLQLNREKPLTSALTLEVLYPPVVTVSPPKIVVNTSDTVLLNCEYVANPASLTHVVWFRNGEMVNVNETNRYEGGNSENVALVIRSTKKNDIGNYTCQLSNVIGKGVSEHQLSLDVQYVPKVEVLMMPYGPVKEDDETNVTLYCNILDANPALLTRVRWYANSSLLKELPDCDETRFANHLNINFKEDLCHVDPSKLLLESIGRGFFYNYSCEGYNAAGWGPRSKEKELVVYYEPGPATLTYFPLVAIKKKSVTFSCHVEEPGYPESNRFRWLRGGRGPLQDIVTRDWTVEPVGLDSRTNYSCYAFNEGGKGGMATVNLDVHAPPFFIRNLPQYTGFYHSVSAANLTCRIECVPRCEINWLKDGTTIDKNDTRFFVKEKYMDASPATGDFESMLSVLHFNMSNWLNGRFDILKDNYNFTCMSSANSVGAGIKSTTCVSIEYAPENTTVSKDIEYVQENNMPGRIICKSKAIPEPKFEWIFNNKSIVLSNALIINTPMTRNDSGVYTCIAKNRHGVSTAETIIDVQFKPRCTLEQDRIDGQDTLICTAFGNPAEASFSWSIKMENESTEWLGDGDSRNYKDKSFFVLEEDYAIARTYRCVANNTVGDGPFCEYEVAVRPTKQLAWWNRWDKTTLIILVAVILVLLLAVIIICCVIICVCRRRRRQEKYDTDVSINTLQSVFSRQSHALVSTPGSPSAPHASSSTSVSNIALPESETHQNLWAATNASGENNESLIAPQLLLTSESKPPPPPPPPPLPSQPLLATANKTAIAANETMSSSIITETTLLQNNSLSVSPQQQQQQPQAPKSPPRWPLRPGVMLHVSNDTKENLAVNRMTLKFPSNTTNTLSEAPGTQEQHMAGLSPLFNNCRPQSALTQTYNNMASTLPMCSKENYVLDIQSVSHTAGDVIESPALPVSVDTIKPIRSTHRGSKYERRVEQFFLNLFRRAKGKLPNDSTRDSQRSHVGLLSGMFWRRQTPEEQDSQFSTKHRLKGIRCSGSVTYKKTHSTLNKALNRSSDAPTATTTTTTSTLTRNEKNSTTAIITTTNPCTNLQISNSNNNDPIPNISCLNINNNNNINSSIILQTAMTSSSQVSTKTASKKQPPPMKSRPVVQRSVSCIDHHRNNNNTSTNSSSDQRSLAFVICPTSSYNPPITVTTTITTTTPTKTLMSRASVSVPTTPHDKTPMRSILKSYSPPIPPPRPQVATTLTKNSSSNTLGRVQIQEKSSTMGDLLTEPGEYENLPFHGLQTAPNKSNFTRPTDFNNDSSHVVLVAPRPKRLTNGGQIIKEQNQRLKLRAEDFDVIEHYDQIVNAEKIQQQQQLAKKQFNLHKQQQRLGTKQQSQQQQHENSIKKSSISGYNDNRIMEIGVPISTSNRIIAGGAATTNGNSENADRRGIMNPHRITTGNLSNCCPKSYTEYYQQQQKIVKQQQQQQQKYNNANISGLPSYAVIDRHHQEQQQQQQQQHRITTTSSATAQNAANNPFLAISNFKKFDNDNEIDNDNDNDNYTKKANNDNKNKSVLSFLNHHYHQQRPESENKFCSFKLPGSGNRGSNNNNNNKSSCGIFGFNAASLVVGNSNKHERNAERSRITNEMSNNNKTHDIMESASVNKNKSILKCKRHHSFTGGSIGDIDAVVNMRTPCAHPSYDMGLNMVNTVSLHHNASGVRLAQQTFATHDDGHLSEHYDEDILPTQLMAHAHSDKAPFYENLNDSVEIYECSADTHTQPTHLTPTHHYNTHQQPLSSTILSSVSRHQLHDITPHLDSTATTTAKLLHDQPNAIQGRNNISKALKKQQQKQHHQRHHQQKNDANNGRVAVMEAERLSIYRSDSGISNSSYECVTPIPGMLGMSRAHIGNTPPPHKAGHKTPKSSAKITAKLSKAYKVHMDENNSGGSVFDKYLEPPFHVASVLATQQKRSPRQHDFMHNAEDITTNDQRELSPAPTLVNSSYESASSSQIDGPSAGGSNSNATDPISLSSGHRSMSQSGSGTFLPRNISRNCLRHQKPSEINSLEDFEQYKLGHNYGLDTLERRRVMGAEHYNELSIMKTANNPFLATNQQNKTSIVTYVNDSNKTNTTHINRKLRRQTISDPNAYIRYISVNYQQQQPQQQQQHFNNSNNNKNNSSIHGKCIPKPSANTLEKSTTTITATASTSRRTTFNDDKSQKQCQQQQQHQPKHQQQQQHQQISLQFQSITLYDDDNAKRQQIINSNNNNHINNNNINNNIVSTINANNKEQQQQQQQQQNIIINSWPWYDDKERVQSLEKVIQQTNATNAYKILSQEKQQQLQRTTTSKKFDTKEKYEAELKEESNVILSHEKMLTSCKMIDGKLSQQIIGCNLGNNNNNNNNNNNVQKMQTFYVNRDNWMGTYPTTRPKKIMSNFSPITTTFTTTTTATRMTPKIVPTAVIASQPPSYRSGYRCLRKHHSFHIQPTTPRQDLEMTNDMRYTQHNAFDKQTHMDILKKQQQPNSTLTGVVEEKDEEITEKVRGLEIGGGLERDVGIEKEKKIIENRYSSWGGRFNGGPLVYRPLALDEKHAFKPISPRPQNNVSMPITDSVKTNKPPHMNTSHKNNYCNSMLNKMEGAEEKSLESAEFSTEMQELKNVVVDLQERSESENSIKGAILHPAASLEVLEALTQSNPELIYAATQPGSRINLHTHLSALNRSHSYTATSVGGCGHNVDGAVNLEVEQMRAKLQAQLCDGNDNNEELSLALSPKHHKRPKKIFYFGDNEFLLTGGSAEITAKNQNINENDRDLDEEDVNEEDEELDNLNRFSFCESLTNDCDDGHNNTNNNNNNNESSGDFDSTSNSKIILNSSINGGQPLSAANFEDEMIYADLESQHYGPINYKAASIYAQVKKNRQTNALEETK